MTFTPFAHTNKPDFSAKKLLRTYPKRQKFLGIIWNNLVSSYMQGIKVIAKCNYDDNSSMKFYVKRISLEVQLFEAL